MVTVTCTSCHKPLSIDETKLPMKEVGFPCPVCKTKLKIDRRTLAAAATPEPAPPQVPAAADEEDFSTKALLAGADSPAIRQAARTLGFEVTHFPTVEACRDFYLQEYPSLVLLHPTQLTPPPLAEMQPVTSLTPADRRKGFFILIADNLKTLDGNAAFLYGVNLVVASKDLGSIRQIYRDAEAFHKRLYQSMNAVERQAET